ncbi:Gfo/Idh/MocA family oxidoreductase [Singulisphaera rosea]
MSDVDLPSGSDHLPLLPSRRDVGIGVVGAGFIVRDCHLVAYAQAGFRVVGLTSRTRAVAEEVASLRGVPKVFNSVAAMLDDPEIEVVDVAVPPNEQPAILRSILDQHTFDFAGTQDAQRYWQHFAILCRLPGDAESHVFCDVAGSNIPFLCLDDAEASAYLNPGRREAILVTITLEEIPLHYHRLAHRQDLPLDLYDAMEHFIESIDVIQTVDNELGLLHTGDYWVGVVAYRNRRELDHIVAEYQRFVGRAGLDPRADLCFARDLTSPRHSLLERFLNAYPHEAGRITMADARIRERIRASDDRFETCYVLLDLKTKAARP